MALTRLRQAHHEEGEAQNIVARAHRTRIVSFSPTPPHEALKGVESCCRKLYPAEAVAGRLKPADQNRQSVHEVLGCLGQCPLPRIAAVAATATATATAKVAAPAEIVQHGILYNFIFVGTFCVVTLLPVQRFWLVL